MRKTPRRAFRSPPESNVHPAAEWPRSELDRIARILERAENAGIDVHRVIAALAIPASVLERLRPHR